MCYEATRKEKAMALTKQLPSPLILRNFAYSSLSCAKDLRISGLLYSSMRFSISKLLETEGCFGE